jgi:hypothetical protein
MKFLFKLFLAIVFAPIVLGVLLVLAILAMVGLPLLWEKVVGKYTAPPEQPPPAT